MLPDGRKMLLHWLVPGDVLGAAAFLPVACSVPRQRRNRARELAAHLGPRHDAMVDGAISAAL